MLYFAAAATVAVVFWEGCPKWVLAAMVGAFYLLVEG